MKRVLRSKARQAEKRGLMITCDEGSCICAKNNINSVIYECVNCGWMVFAICQPCYDLKRNPTIVNKVLGNYTVAELKGFVSPTMSLDTLMKLRGKAGVVLDVTEDCRERERVQNTLDLTLQNTVDLTL